MNVADQIISWCVAIIVLCVAGGFVAAAVYAAIALATHGHL